MGKPIGLPKTGGRQAGTPNKATATVRNWIVELINNNREQIEQDLQQLEPKDRLLMFEKLLPFILPKTVQATDVEGAAYTRSDIVDGGSVAARWYPPTIQQWYEREPEQETTESNDSNTPAEAYN